jgi:hypothetical protein
MIWPSSADPMKYGDFGTFPSDLTHQVALNSDRPTPNSK